MDTISNIILSGVIFIFLIGLIVFIHELGHFIAAKKAGIYVQEFAFGFGKKLFGKKYKGTEYRINLIPLGGYVKMLGDLDGSSFLRYNAKAYDPKDKEFSLKLFKDNKIDIKKDDFSKIEEFGQKMSKKLKSEDYIKLQTFLISDYIPNHKGNYDNVSAGKRAIVISAGVIMNLILAILLFYIFFFITGFYTDVRKIGDPSFVGSKVSNPPYLMFLEGTDNVNYSDSIVIRANGKIVNDEDEFKKLVEDNYNKSISLELQRLSETGYYYTNANVILNGDGIKSNFDSDIVDKPYVTVVSEDGLASDLGIVPGDFLYGVNDVTFKSGDNISTIISSFKDQKVDFKYVNQIGLIESKSVEFKANEEGRVVLGVQYSQIDSFPDLILRLDYSDTSALSGVSHGVNMTIYNFYGLYQLVKQSIVEKSIEPVSSSVSSIVGVSDYVYSLVKMDDFANIVNLAALVSLSLGVMNILPIPLFDGGHLLFIIIEKIRGKKLSEKIQEKISAIAFYALIALSIIIVLKDIFQMDFFGRLIGLVKSLFGI